MPFLMDWANQTNALNCAGGHGKMAMRGEHDDPLAFGAVCVAGVRRGGAAPWPAGVLSMLGVGLLIATVMGILPEIGETSKHFLTGMSVAMPFGSDLYAWLRWKSFRPRLVNAARTEGATRLLRLLGESE